MEENSICILESFCVGMFLKVLVIFVLFILGKDVNNLNFRNLGID